MPKPIGSTFSRRAVAVGIAVSPLTLSGSASAQQPAPTPAAPPRVKGPRVWLDLDQKELDDAYDQSVYAPNIRTVLQRTARNSELVRDRIGAPKRFSYGPTRNRSARRLYRQDARTRRCTCSSMAAPGAAASPRTITIRPRCSSMPARISSCPTSSMSRRTAATCSAWPIRCGVRWPGPTRTPRASAAIPTASTSAAIRPAAIGPACC